MGWILFFVFVAIVIFMAKGKLEKQKLLRERYDEAIRSGDKSRALAAGRDYYSELRGNGKLTVYDESAITNDLLAMGNTAKTLPGQQFIARQIQPGDNVKSVVQPAMKQMKVLEIAPDGLTCTCEITMGSRSFPLHGIPIQEIKLIEP